MSRIPKEPVKLVTVPSPNKIPERDILLETRKGVALSYAPTQIAI